MCTDMEDFNTATQMYLQRNHPRKIRFNTRRSTDPYFPMQTANNSMWTSDHLYNVSVKKVAQKEYNYVKRYTLIRDSTIARMLLSRLEYVWKGGSVIGVAHCPVALCKVKVMWKKGSWSVSGHEANGGTPENDPPFQISLSNRGPKYSRLFSNTINIWFNEAIERFSIHYLEAETPICSPGKVLSYYRTTHYASPVGVIGFDLISDGKES
ncbi:hypothetical protein DSO57_1034422 [Entomophthora muscae]|uniref:Uncharacterized protein n=1 Tax=Entomophthora muscae TaxID=34485 RepID=A0ACC2UJW2_9FUNG|nr:hypothetical protein DSO57_1034422 [Entomophthora muscae]